MKNCGGLYCQTDLEKASVEEIHYAVLLSQESLMNCSNSWEMNFA